MARKRLGNLASRALKRSMKTGTKTQTPRDVRNAPRPLGSEPPAKPK